jgi:carboxylesterase
MTARQHEAFDREKVAPWQLGEGRRGTLLLHGFAGTPPELRRLGEYLSERGWRCHAPALPGHAADPQALERSTWQEWSAAALDALNDLTVMCDVVVVAGQSMGATLALHVAAHDLRVAAVASLAAPLWLNGFLQRFLPIIQHAVRWHEPGSDVDLWDPTAVDELYSYAMRSTRAINELRRMLATVRDELVQIRAPVLILHGGRDRMVSRRCADELEARLVASRAVAKHIFPRSGHAISVDVDREAINQLVHNWFEEHMAASTVAEAAAAG